MPTIRCDQCNGEFNDAAAWQRHNVLTHMIHSPSLRRLETPPPPRRLPPVQPNTSDRDESAT